MRHAPPQASPLLSELAVASQRHAEQTYYPALDGLRAIAVTAVVLYHADVAWLPGGLLGVDLFFVISGFLITGLLRNRQGPPHVVLSTFWQRRAWRLLPAQLVIVMLVSVAYAVLHPALLQRLRGDVVATLLQVENWHLIWNQRSYFEEFGRPSPLRHFWSLGLEMQFYLLWPLAMRAGLARVSRAVGVALCAALAIASAGWMALLYDPALDPSRVYFGFDTHGSALWVGAALSFVMEAPARVPSRVPVPRAFGWRALGWLALAALVGGFAFISEVQPSLYRGGFLGIALVAAVALHAVITDTGLLRRILSAPIARYLGQRSYSIYLWHWPIFCLTLSRQDLPFDGPSLLALRLLLTVVMAELAYRFVEQPLRYGNLSWHVRKAEHALGRRGWMATQTVVALLAGACVAGVSPLWTARPAPTPVRATAPVLTINDRTNEHDLQPTHEPTDEPTDEASRPQQAREALPRRIVSFGDSVMLGARRKLHAKGARWSVNAAQGRQASDTVELIDTLQAAGPLPGCAIIHIGNNGTLLRPQLDAMLRSLRGARLVVLVNTTTPKRWRDANNDVIRDVVAARQPWVRLADWRRHSASHPDWFRTDGLHLTSLGADAYAQFLIDTMTTPRPSQLAAQTQ